MVMGGAWNASSSSLKTGDAEAPKNKRLNKTTLEIIFSPDWPREAKQRNKTEKEKSLKREGESAAEAI